MFSKGEGGPQDFARARALFDQACTGGDAKACDLAAKLPGDTAGPGREVAAVEPRSAPEAGSAGGACTAEIIAGVYESRWGDIACRPGGSGLECCYGSSAGCQKMLHLELMPDGRNLVGYWEYRSGERGPAEFGLTDSCELTDGRWGYGSSRANNSWSVAGRK